MSKHKKINGRLLQLDKKYSQLKAKQREKISAWMYEAYKRQKSEKLTDDEALLYVFDKIEEAEIWIPDYEIKKKYISKKNKFKNRLASENVPKYLFEMESILNKATQQMDTLEKAIADFENIQDNIKKLEVYYTSPQWKQDYYMDEKGAFPEKLKRGILSEDGIYNMLERNKELLEMLFNKKKYTIDFCGQEYAWKNAKKSYLPGETVTLYYYMVATDTDYSFTLDDQYVSTDYETDKGFIISFVMPEHDVVLRVFERNTMLRMPPES